MRRAVQAHDNGSQTQGHGQGNNVLGHSFMTFHVF